jgi:hypothetical protein
MRQLDRASVSIDPVAPRLVRIGLVTGAAGLLGSVLPALFVQGGIGRMLQSYLTAYAFFLSLTLGALFFVVLQHLVRAGWSVVVRRPAEALAMNLPWLALFFVPVLAGARVLYPWADAGRAAQDALLRWKHPYLNLPFFTIRWAVYFAVWIWTARYFWSRSLRTDLTGDVGLTRDRERLSGAAMVLFALTTNFASYDLLMSLAPHWYSTIFGVYFYSGGVVGFFALLSIVIMLLQRSGRLGGIVTDEHYHDLGKLVFAFTVFWAYIAFSQYMLIWYGNIPEETEWFLRRQRGGWQAMSLLLLFGHFVLPFLYLLPRFVKRSPKLFGPAAAWVLLMHYVDIYWQVMPEFRPAGASLDIFDLACPLALGGFLLAATVARLRGHPLVPERDPRLEESLAFESV